MAITLTDLKDWQIYQETSSEEKSITITGSCSGISSVEARVVLNGTSTEVVTWTTIDASPTTSFSGVLTVPTGAWYNVQVRDNLSNVSNGSNKWGVGIVVAAAGQSNMSGYHEREDTLTANDKTSMYIATSLWQDPYGNGTKAFLNRVNNETGKPVALVNMGISGAALLAVADSGPGYYLDLTSNEPYDVLMDGIDDATDSDNKIAYLLWSQGERETGADVSASVTKEAYKSGLLTLFSRIRAVVSNKDGGTLDVLFSVLARTTDRGDEEVQKIRDAQTETIAENANLYRASNKITLGLRDTVHVDDDGFQQDGIRFGQTVAYLEGYSAYYRGQQIQGYKQIGNNIFDVYFKHDGGTAMTPKTDITGFSILDDASEETITSAVQLRGNIIRLTISGTITGIPTVRYLYGENPTVTNYVKDNTALELPMESMSNIPKTEQSDNESLFFGSLS